MEDWRFAMDMKAVNNNIKANEITTTFFNILHFSIRPSGIELSAFVQVSVPSLVLFAVN